MKKKWVWLNFLFFGIFAYSGWILSVRAETTDNLSQWLWQGRDHITSNEKNPGLSWIQTDGTHVDFSAEKESIDTSSSGTTRRMEGSLAGIATMVSYTLHTETGEVTVDIQMDRPATSEDLVEGTLVWSLPLALAPRKRVWMQGDYGVEWETRYFYEFMVGSAGGVLSEPDRNEWRYFGMDQLSPHAVRLWKQESRKASPLIMQEGRFMVPAMQIFDQQGGLFVEFPFLPKQSETRVELDASGAGLLTKSTPVVLDAKTPQFRDRMVLIPFKDQEKGITLRQKIASRYPWGARPAPEEVLQEEKWLRETPEKKGFPSVVTGGYPFAKGELSKNAHVGVQMDGKSLPVQFSPLAYWPDGSVKWALLTFPFAAGDSSAHQVDAGARVTTRTQEAIPVQIRVEKESSPTFDHPLLVEREGEGSQRVHVRNGKLEVVLNSGEHWLESLTYNGESLLDSDSSERLAYTDYAVAPAAWSPFGSSPKGTDLDRGTLYVDHVDIEENGPLRTVIRLEGLTTNREPTRIIMRVTFVAGVPQIQFSHTAVFRFADPRKTFLSAMGVALPFRKGKAESNEIYLGGEKSNALSATLIQETPFHQRVVADGKSLSEGKENLQGWLWTEWNGMGIAASLRYFWQRAPMAIGWEGATNTLRFGLWPRDAEGMDVRRYSNYPHLGQGETTTDKNDWVETVYYPKKPFYGLATTHEFQITLDVPKEDVQTLAANFQSPPLLYAGWDRYDATGVVLPAAAEKDWPHAWDAWTRLTRFFFWHRIVYGWYGKWVYGDFQHKFRTGYGWLVSPAFLMKHKPWEHRVERPDASQLIHDYVPPNDWAYDNGRWGWSNTEGLINFFLQQEYLRKGNRAVYFAAEALARHSRDVVTRNEGDLLGLGTRHGVQPWSDGDHEERQTTPLEYRYHYFLSGDGRSRDVSDLLYKKIYSQKPVIRNASHSGRLSGLLFHWELTGDEAEGVQLQKYIRLLCSPEGLYTSANVGFPDPHARGKHEDLNRGQAFFHSFGGMHTLVEYYYLTKDESLKESIIAMANAAFSDPKFPKQMNGRSTWPSSSLFFAPFAFALQQHAEDAGRYRKYLIDAIQEGVWQAFYQPVSLTPEHWSGSTGFLEGNVGDGFFWQTWAPYVAYSLGKEEVWNEDIARKFDEKEKVGRVKKQPLELSWQSTYDEVPELETYLRQPWLDKVEKWNREKREEREKIEK